MSNKPISYQIDVCTQGSCDFVIKGGGALWFNQLAIKVSPPLGDNAQERLGHVIKFLEGIEMRPYENLAGYEEQADQCAEEMKAVIDRLKRNGLNEPFIHRGRIQLTIRPMLSLDSSELPGIL